MPQPPAADDPSKLLASANAASGPARNAWLAFLGLLAYLLVTLAGVTHMDLLLNSPVTLPIVNVKIPLFSFFRTAPFLLWLVHLGLLVQHAMLAHKYQHFSEAVARSEGNGARDHPERRLVHNYVFSQLLAGPKPPWLLHMLMRSMVFITLIFLPVLVLLYFQITFLPYHDVAITHAHRIAILLDLALIFIVRPYIAMPYLRPRWPKLGFGKESWRWELGYASFGVAVSLCLVILSFSLLVATVPQACVWPFGEQSEEKRKECFSLDRTTARWWRMHADTEEQPRDIFAPTMWLFGPNEPGARKSNPSFFEGQWLHRNLQLSEATLVREAPSLEVIARYRLAGKHQNEAITDLARGLNLKGRDLRYANLLAVRLYEADLRRAKLQGANLFEADLQGANLRLTELQGVEFGSANLRGVDLTGAKLEGAALGGANLRGANLTGARLVGAGLQHAAMHGADLTRAKLQNAYLRWTSLQGAYLGAAELQGADLSFARLQGATLTSAKLQGARLHGGRLHGADLRSAQLQGASLIAARLQGVNLSSADLQGTKLRLAQLQWATFTKAKIWQVKPPKKAQIENTDMGGIIIELPNVNKLVEMFAQDVDEYMEKFAPFEDEAFREGLEKLLAPLLDERTVAMWADSPERQAWSELRSHSKSAPTAAANFLVNLACNDDTGGYIVNGIARRLLRLTRAEQDPVKLGAKALVDKKTCPAAMHLGENTLAALKKISAPVEAPPRTKR